MIRKLLFVFCFLIVSVSAYSRTENCNSVLAKGVGSNSDLALQKAFRAAIEKYAGILILSETEIKNFALVRDEIMSYSAHYIEQYKIIDQSVISNNVSVTIDACVSSTRIGNRILGRNADSSALDGTNALAKLRTYRESRERARLVMRKVLDSYVQKAYESRIGATKFIITNTNAAEFYIEYEIVWNKNFLDSLQDALEATRNMKFTPNGADSVITMIYHRFRPSDLFTFNVPKVYYFSDQYIYDDIYLEFHYHKKRFVHIVLSKNGAITASTCKELVSNSFFENDGRLRSLYINKNGSHTEKLTIVFRPDEIESALSSDKVSVSVEEKC